MLVDHLSSDEYGDDGVEHVAPIETNWRRKDRIFADWSVKSWIRFVSSQDFENEADDEEVALHAHYLFDF